MTKILFFLGMMTIPFSGVVGLGFLGELQNNLSTYFFIAAIVSGAQFFATSSGILRAQGQEIPSTKLLAGIMLAVTIVIAVSFFVNAGSILTNVSHGRHAIEKFVSSFVLILYSFMLAYLTFFIAGHGWERAIRKPIAISALLCVAFSVFEILSPLGIATGVYAFLDGIVHGGLTPPGYAKGWDPRIRSLAFEPPDFGNYAGFAWPWLMAGWVSSHGRARYGYAVVWVFLTALVLYSGARTGLVLMAGVAFVLAVLRYGYLPPKPYKKGKSKSRVLTVFLTCLVLAAVLFCAANLQQYETDVIAGSSVSDLSRLASIEAAFNMFRDKPVFGLGLGQYGFYFDKYLPRWGHSSYEIANWLAHKPEQGWPASYLVYARLAAELGLAGLVMWIGLWIWLARSVLIASLNYQRATGLVPTAAYPLIASCFCVLFSGFTTDTFRTPMIWVTLGLCCRYLFEIRKYVQQQHDLRHLKLNRIAIPKISQRTSPAPGPRPRRVPVPSPAKLLLQRSRNGVWRAKIAEAVAIIANALHSNANSCILSASGKELILARLIPFKR